MSNLQCPKHDGCHRNRIACETFIRRECTVRFLPVCTEYTLVCLTGSINTLLLWPVIYYVHAIRYRLESIANVSICILVLNIYLNLRVNSAI